MALKSAGYTLLANFEQRWASVCSACALGKYKVCMYTNTQIHKYTHNVSVYIQDMFAYVCMCVCMFARVLYI